MEAIQDRGYSWYVIDDFKKYVASQKISIVYEKSLE